MEMVVRKLRELEQGEACARWFNSSESDEDEGSSAQQKR